MTTMIPLKQSLSQSAIIKAQPYFSNSKSILATIESIATGTPEHCISQVDAARTVAQMPNLVKNQSRIETLYQNTRINTRHLALNLLSEDALTTTQSSSIQDRMQMYQSYAIPLAERVVKQALESATAKSTFGCPELLKDSIRQIVFVSSTGFVAPGVDTKVIKRLGLRRDISRVTVNFMGCAAAMNGLRVASDHVRSHPTHRSLVICLELSSVNAVFEDDINDVIIHSIFGDGCAAVVVGACEEGQALEGRIVIRDYLSQLIADTEDGITLGVQDNGITCKLSRQLPDYIEAGVDPVIESFLEQNGLTKEQIDLWAIHPGGTRIVERSQRSLGLSDDQVAYSWEILSEYGNMLSASILFVLERMLSKQESSDERLLTGLAFSFSPGVGIEGILFQKL
ncbi:naringenin-chalcone synthase [Cyanobacteria bacterium FACHB-DQ100]|nr:naringenin-chalcone synthase [Cyanobacteria bacterium FACHB-DQ100]